MAGAKGSTARPFINQSSTRCHEDAGTYYRVPGPTHHSRAAATRLQPSVSLRLTCRPRALPVRAPIHLQYAMVWPLQPLQGSTRRLGLHGKAQPSITGCNSSRHAFQSRGMLGMLVQGGDLMVHVKLWSAAQPQHVLWRGCAVRAHAPPDGPPSVHAPPAPAVSPPLAMRQLVKPLASELAAHPPAACRKAHINTLPSKHQIHRLPLPHVHRPRSPSPA